MAETRELTTSVSATLAQYIDQQSTKELIVKTLGKNRMQTFIGSALSVVQDPKLKDVEPESLFNCMLKTATYNLPVDNNLGMVFYIPYKNKQGVKICQFQMGFKGLLQLAIRSGQYRRINASEVREGEYAGKDFFGEPVIQWKQDRDSLPIIGYMAAFELNSGLRKIVYMSNEDLKEHADKYSKAHRNAQKDNDFDSDLWVTDFDSMSKKTVIKKVLSFGPKSIELQDALKFDQAEIKRDDNGNENAIYVDNDNTVAEEPITMETSEAIEAEEVKDTETKEEEILVVLYSEYLNHKDIYEKKDYPDGSKAYQIIDGKKTIRVKKIK